MVREIIRERMYSATPELIRVASGAVLDIPLRLGRDGTPAIRMRDLLNGLQATLSLAQHKDVNTGNYTPNSGQHGFLETLLMAEYRYTEGDIRKLNVRSDNLLMISENVGVNRRNVDVTMTGGIDSLAGPAGTRIAATASADPANADPIRVGYNSATAAGMVWLKPGERHTFRFATAGLNAQGTAGDVVALSEQRT